MSRRRLIGLAALAAFVGSVVLANALVEHVGPVGVGFGLMAPAGVYVAGAAFLLRDVVDRTLGRAAVLGAIAAGAALAALISPALAVASAVAFAASELVDLAVFAPLERRGFVLAAVASNVAGAVVDSVLFLSIAFGSLAFLEGQIVGKLWVTAAFVAAAALVAAARRTRAAT